jgi:hypothetical protein
MEGPHILNRTFPEICTKFDAVPLSGNRITSDTQLEIKACKQSTRPPSCMKRSTLTLKTCYSNHLLLHGATTTAVQMVLPVPDIMDTRTMSWNYWRNKN